MKRGFLFFSWVVMFAGNVGAQEFGGFPPSIKWKQINTDTARILFSPEIDSQAQQIAAIIHRIITQRPNSLGSTVKKINILLQNYTTLANGYVALAPFRSEYYLIPGSDVFEFGANPWYQELATHEFRHVLQFSNFNKGVSRVASYILGEEGQALMNALVIPDWFWEGDAVHAETQLTPQGRGRNPYFFDGYKSLWSEGRKYSWMKLRSGSMKDYVPDYYQLGYLLVNYGYLKYGSDFWRKVTTDAVQYKGLIYPFQKAVKKYSGIRYKTFRQQALNYYNQQVSRKRTDSITRATVTDYRYAQFIGKDSLLYEKSGYKTLPAFYIKDKNGEHRLRLRNITSEDWFSYRKGMIAYTAYEPNARWGLIDYSTIYVYNIHSGEERKLTHKEKYLTPDIAPSAAKLVAVHVNSIAETTLEVMDMEGKVLKVIRPVNHYNFLQPKFIDENTIVVAERLPGSMMQLSIIDVTTEKKEVVIPSTPALIGEMYPYKNSVYFVSSLTGNDDIYSIRLSDRKVFKLTSGATGKYYPGVFNDSLTFSEFTSNGLLLREKFQSIQQAAETGPGAWEEVTLPFAVANADSSTNMLNDSTRQFSVSRYHQGSHLFYFHSWRPYYSRPEFTLSLFSDNILNTFSNQIYYRYNQNETSHAVGFTSSYAGLFPVINAGVEYTFSRTVKDTAQSYELNQLEENIGFNIPLNFTGGRMCRFLNFGSAIVFNQTKGSGGIKSPYDRSYGYLYQFLTWSHYLPKAIQQIYPKFGYTISLAHRQLVSENGFQFSGTARLYLPSFGNHSIVIDGSWQETDTSDRTFSNRFANSRGYSAYYFSRMWRVGGNYHFPIVYPDVGIANIVFFQRIRGTVFYDFTKVYSANKAASKNLRSTGLEIYFDTKAWNELPISFGFRVSHLLDKGFSLQDNKGSNWFEFILPVNLVPQR